MERGEVFMSDARSTEGHIDGFIRPGQRFFKVQLVIGTKTARQPASLHSGIPPRLKLLAHFGDIQPVDICNFT